MRSFSRLYIAQAMQQHGIIPVFYHPDVSICFQVIEACYKGGLPVFEFTNRGYFAHEVFASLKKKLAEAYPEIILGAGSVMDAGTASLYMQLGAHFIVSPVLHEEIARVCNRRKVLWSPGCGSLSEISYAEELGAEIVKIFPGAQVGGPEFVRAVRGPMPWTSLMPAGGVSPVRESLAGWFHAGVCCVGMGSQLISGKLVAEGDYKQIEETVRNAVRLLKDIRSEGTMNKK